MDAVSQAADMLFGENTRMQVLNIKFATPSRGRTVSANQLAQQVIYAENAVRSGKARFVTQID